MKETNYTWPDLITRLIQRQNLSASDAAWAMDEMMSGEATDIHLAGFLVALRAKGETVAELAGLADSMLAHAVPVDIPEAGLDIVGTGGDRAFTVNISTMAAVVAAAAGIRVVKHGNRASSSRSGSADVLEALGVNISLPVARVEALASEVGITFCFAPVFHPSMRFTAPARAGLGVATAFNFLGPLTNPARPAAAAIGCADRRMAPLMAGVLAGRGTQAMVFRGERDGLDELAPTGPARVWQVHDQRVDEIVIDPVSDLGLDAIQVSDLRGGDARHNAAVARAVLVGQGTTAIRQTVLLNAAAGIVADGHLPGLGSGDVISSLLAGMDIAANAIDSGRATETLEAWIEASNRGF